MTTANASATSERTKTVSKCISSHGEYSEHEPGENFTCQWCWVFDEAGALERIAELEADDMKLWSARNGFLGYGQVACLVEAETESEAREIAARKFREYSSQPGYDVVRSIVQVDLPYVGDELP